MNNLRRSDLRVANGYEFWSIANLFQELGDLARRGFKRQGHRDLIKKFVLLSCRRNISLTELQTNFLRRLFHDGLQLDRSERGIVASNQTSLQVAHVFAGLFQQPRVMSLSDQSPAISTELLFFTANFGRRILQGVKCGQDAK